MSWQRIAIVKGLFTDERVNTIQIIEGDKYDSQAEFIERVGQETASWLTSGSKHLRVIDIQIILED